MGQFFLDNTVLGQDFLDWMYDKYVQSVQKVVTHF